MLQLGGGDLIRTLIAIKFGCFSDHTPAADVCPIPDPTLIFPDEVICTPRSPALYQVLARVFNCIVRLS